MDNIVFGIDISKDTFDGCLIRGKEKFSVAYENNAKGFKKLEKWLKKRNATTAHTCMEATGRYGDELAYFLHQKGYRVSIVNPKRIKKYRDSKLSHTKTDKQDAALIADFCLTQNPYLWTPPAPERRELQALVRRLQVLIDSKVQEQNRLQSGENSTLVLESIQSHLNYIISEIEQLERLIHEHVKQYPDLREDLTLLLSIPGIGHKTAILIMAELSIERFESADQAVSSAGLCPTQHHSGSSVHRQSRLSRNGNPRLKKALYFPAMTAIRYNSIIRSLAERLTNRGKCKMQIIGAAMRKLLRLAYGVLKSRQPFDADYHSKTQIA